MLTYHSNGEGPVVVLLHAFPLSSAMWQQQLAEIGQYAYIVVPNLPGFGTSSRQGKPSIAGMAEEVGILLDHLNIQGPVTIGGLSMGGYVAFEFLLKFPERVQALMLFSTRAGEDDEKARQGRYETIRSIETFGMESFARKIQAKLLAPSTLDTRPELVGQVSEMIVTNHFEGVTDALRAMADRRDFSKLLEAISCPVLIAAGEEDRLISPSESEKMYAKIHGAELFKIPRAGHLINLENPGYFDAMVENFLKTRVFVRSSENGRRYLDHLYGHK